MDAKITPRIGLVPTGHRMYWDQFPGLKERGLSMFDRLRAELSRVGQVVDVPLVDNDERGHEAAEYFRKEQVDILLIYPFCYATGMCIAPVARVTDVPVVLLNAHEDATFDYKNADTETFLHHEGFCCIPEYAGTLVSLGKKFAVVTGHFGQDSLWDELRGRCMGAAAARAFRGLRFGVIGNTYTNMTDMPTDEHRLLKSTGRLLIRPEVGEVEEAFDDVTAAEIGDMLGQFREMYRLESNVLDEHLRLSARIAVAYQRVIEKYDISAFGYFWWGQNEKITQLRAQSALAVSRLAAMGWPGVTEGDVKTAMAMKVFDLLGAGGMFLEFFCMDYEGDFVIVGHDGPSNVNMASQKPLLRHLDVHHGKTGHGIGIDFEVRPGPVTLLNLTQFGESDTFKLIYTVAEVVPGDVYEIGNPNCRLMLGKPIPEFINDWCQQGPTHHFAMGLDDRSLAVETFAQAMGFSCVKV